MSGIGLENYMIHLFEEAGFDSYYPDKQELLSRADNNKKLRPIIETVSSTLERKRGYEICWGNLSSKYILDHIYKIDHGILTFDKSHVCKIGIQITKNPDRVYEKYQLLLELQKAGAYQGLFDNVIVIYTKVGAKQGGVFWTDEEKDAVIDRLYDAVDRACGCSLPFVAEIQMP
jgi:hypothetical protein